MSLSDLASLSLSSSPPTASLRLGRSLAQLDLSTWPVAYFEAVQGLDDDVEGLSDGVRRELVLAAGKAAGGASVWDLAVVHYQEASDLPATPSSGLLPSDPTPTPKEDVAKALTAALQNLQRLSQHPRLLQKLGEKKLAFLQEAFPGLGESSDEDESGSDAEWESDDGDEEDDGDEADEGEEQEDVKMTST